MTNKQPMTDPSTICPTCGKATLFIVVLEDRHTDPDISVHQTRAGADAKFDEHKAGYAREGYEWSDELGEVDADHWVRYERTESDDGPSIRIEWHEVQP